MSNLSGKSAAVLVEKFYEDLELWYPVYRLREAGCEVKLVGPKGGESYASKHGYPAKSDIAASDVSANDFDGIIIPGGYSPDHMRRHKSMVDLVTEAEVPGLSEEEFQKHAQAAKVGCPVSKALTGVDITLDAALES